MALEFVRLRGAMARLAMGVAALALGAGAAQALPSTKIGTASLLTPAAANTYYGAATTSTNSTGEATRPKEVQELARALKGDPDLIYEYVRNNTEIVWTYGLTKGAMGVIVDRAGSAFDQAHLMVELLRQSGYTASFKLGTITLTGAQFADWSGITSATAACQLLSSGGIPAIINGTTTAACSYGAATVSTIEIGHAWVSATIGGTAFVFDPAYKPHTFKAGLNLATATGMSAGGALAAGVSGASTGTTSGISYASSFNYSNLNASLAGYANTLDATIAASAPGGSIADVVGGQTVVPYAIPTGGLRQISLPYTSTVQRTIAGNLPDGYRTSLRVQLTKLRPDASTPTVIDKTLYVDEIYGRKLIFDTDMDPTGASFSGALKLIDEFGAAVSLAQTGAFADNPTFSKGAITLTANLPYAANSGGYMDATLSRPITYALPFMVVHGWGDTGRGLIDKWGARRDTAQADANSSFNLTRGDGRRELLAAEWLAQASRAARLHAAIAKSTFAQHYAIGISSADTGLNLVNSVYRITDSFDRLEVETGLSLTSKTATATDRRAAIQAVAATLSTLKGSVSDQVSDLPDVSSVATRFAWGNAPEPVTGIEGGAARPFYRYASTADAAQALGLTKAENGTAASSDGVVTASEATQRRQAVADAVSAYVGAGFTVVTSAESFLGPGARAGGNEGATAPRSRQRGGALTASRYDANGDPLEIATVLVGLGGQVDGGGGGAQMRHQASSDPATAADVVKGRFINGLPGAVSITSPAKVVVGKGGFPYELDGGYFWRDTEARDDVFGPLTHREPQGGWSSNWENNLSLSGSGLEAMGETDPRAAIGTVAAFYAAQDTYKAAPGLQREVVGQLINAWWAASLSDNVATVSVGASVRQFVRKPDGAWFAPGPGGYATLAQTGAVTVGNGDLGGDATARQRIYGAVSLDLTGPQGDVQHFVNWSATPVGGKQHGFHLATWTFPSGVVLTYSYQNAVPTLYTVANNVGSNQTLYFGPSGLNDPSGTMKVSIDQSAGQPVTHTDSVGAVTKFAAVTLGTGVYEHYRLEKIYSADDASSPSSQNYYDTLGRLKETKDKLALAGQRASSQLFLANGLRAETLNPLGYSSVTYADDAGRPIRSVNALGAVTTNTYDGLGRLLTTTAPEGDKIQIDYNARNQPIKQTLYAKPGSAEAGQTIVTETGWDTTWNQPAWTKDPKGAQTDYTYSLGKLQQTTYPAPNVGDDRPTENAYYYNNGLTMTVNQVMGQSVSMTYSNVSVNSFTNTVGSLTGAYPLSLDAHGDPIVLSTPRDARYSITYDNLRRPTLTVEPQIGSAPQVAQRTTYDLLGQVTMVERGSYSGSTFTPIETYSAVYDAVGNRVKDIGPAGVVQTSYDALNRVVCQAVRMNPDVYGALPADACVASTPGANGPDRITRVSYDAIGQVVQQESGVGSTLQQVTARYAYSPNGLKTGLVDSVGNRSTMEYDGFGRLAKLRYPAAPRGSGVSSTTDFEQYTYDVNGNRLSWRKRSGLVINYQYDALNRLTVKDLPNTTSGDVYYTYLDSGRTVQARFGSATSSLFWRTIVDQAGRRIDDARSDEWGPRAVTSVYDNEGNLAQVNVRAASANYSYDLAGRLSGLSYTTPSITSPSTLATIAYGPLDRPSAVTRPNGVNTTYAYDGAGRLSSLVHAAAASSTLGFYESFSYNPQGEVAGQGQVAAPYVWSGQPTTSTNFTHDQLNRDAAMVAASGYDADGNLISDGVRTFTYDAENRLTSVAGGAAPITLSYDPWGRLDKLVSNGNTTDFGYNGAALVEERTGLNIHRSYIHGLGSDVPLVWLEAGEVNPDVRWLHADRLGSIVATSSVGGTLTPYTYGPYGEPQTWAGSRFRYTGQTAIPEVQLYYYKARVYDPALGRFLQTDPIGYGSGPNLYAYVRGTPVNATDPAGLSDLWGGGQDSFGTTAAVGGGGCSLCITVTGMNIGHSDIYNSSLSSSLGVIGGSSSINGMFSGVEDVYSTLKHVTDIQILSNVSPGVFESTARALFCDAAGLLGQNGRLRLGVDVAGGVGSFGDAGFGLSVRNDGSIEVDGYIGFGAGLGAFGGIGLGVDNAGGTAHGGSMSGGTQVVGGFGVPVWGLAGISATGSAPFKTRGDGTPTFGNPTGGVGLGVGPKYGAYLGVVGNVAGTYRTQGAC